MDKVEEKLIIIPDILLDPENPRHDIIDSQRELIHVMVQDQQDKLAKLAKDIVGYGINPGEQTLVMPHEDSETQFIVLEGNRRIAALKILHTPGLLPSTASRSLKKQFADLHRDFIKNPILDLKCVVFPNREAASHWIFLKHTGENQGVGTVSWNASVKRRFEARQNKASVELQIIDFLLSQQALTKEEKEFIRTMSSTTVRRIINDPDVRAALGLFKEDGILRTHLTKEELTRGLRNFLMPFAKGVKKVTDVYHKDDRKDYLIKFRDADPSALPDITKITKNLWDVGSPPEETPPINRAPAREEKESDQKGKRTFPLSTKRKYLIPSSCILRIQPPRINAIFKELREVLCVEDCPNAVAVLFRVFFELSLDHFIDWKRISGVNKDSHLRQKVEAVGSHLEEKKILTKHELKPFRTAANNPNSIISVNTFNSFVHNPNLHPKPTELKIIWDEHQPVMEKLWG